MTGSLYKRGKIWWMAYYVDGIQHCVSAGTANKRLAQKILNLRLAEVIEGRFQLPKTNPPRFKQFSGEFLDSIGHQNTKKRYTTSVKKLREHFGDIRLSEFSLDRIEGYKEARRKAKVRSATINRDLAVLRCILRVALRKRLIAPNSLPVIEMLEERKERRQPHILTFNEERKLMAAAADHIRVLAVLILDAGLRSGKEALALKWENIDFANDSIESKSPRHTQDFAACLCPNFARRNCSIGEPAWAMNSLNMYLRNRIAHRTIFGMSGAVGQMHWMMPVFHTSGSTICGIPSPVASRKKTFRLFA